MTLLDAALEYAAKGWAVFPLRPGEKVPIGGRGHLDASTDLTQIKTWWAQHPDANIGGAVGLSGLVALDVDVAEGKPGRASLAEIDAQLPDTLTQITGRGGLHVIYKRPPDVSVGRRIGFKPGLDLIGDGYIVLAPSVLKDGGQYRWNRVVEPAPLPPVLVQAARAPKATVDKVQLTGTPIITGSRNVALFKLGAALRDQGIGAEALARALDAENKQRCNPPLDDVEMALIVNSVLQRVMPSRDVAIGAVVQQEVAQMFAPQSRSEWIENVGAVTQPPVVFYSTGFEDLDRLLGGGFATRQMAGLIAPPSTGKSALVGEWALALEKHRPVLQVSTELPRFELFVRGAARKLSFPWREGLRGKVDQQTMVNAVRGTRIRLLGCDDLDRTDPLASIEAEVASMAQANGGIAPIIIVDYVQMLARGSASEMRHKVGELTMRLRVMAQTWDTVVIAVFSTSRAYYGGKQMDAIRAANDPTAYLGAAKESGDIEFDCATLLFLDVDKLYEGNPKPARVAVARCRVGDVGFVGLQAQLDVGKFWGDPAAAQALAVDDRKAKRDEKDLEGACHKLLDVIQRFPGQAWRDMQAAMGCNFNLAAAARAKLINDKVIAQVKRTGYDQITHQKLKGDTLVIQASPTNANGDGHADSER